MHAKVAALVMIAFQPAQGMLLYLCSEAMIVGGLQVTKQNKKSPEQTPRQQQLHMNL